MKPLHRNTAASIALLAFGASASELPVEQEAFSAMVAREVVLGTSMKDAEDRLIAMGLRCQPVIGGWTNNVSDRTKFLFCSYQSGWLVQRRWQVGVLPLEQKVAEVRATVGLVGP